MIDLAIKIHVTVIDDEPERYGEEHVVFDVVEPGTGYLVERCYNLMDAVRWAAIPMCQMVHYGYPHPGCAEFAPPDEIPCGREATHRVEFIDRYWAPDDTQVVYFCDDHTAEMHDHAADPREGFEITTDGPLPVRETAS